MAKTIEKKSVMESDFGIYNSALVKIAFVLNACGSIFLIAIFVALFTTLIRHVDSSTITYIVNSLWIRIIMALVSGGSFLLFLSNVHFWSKHDKEIGRLLLLLMFSLLYSNFYYLRYVRKALF